MVLNLRHLHSTSRRQFIPAEGIDVDILKAYLSSPEFGGKADVRPAVNFADGTDGFLVKHSVQLRPTDIEYLKEQTHRLRRERQQYRSTEYFDHLHNCWGHHRDFLESEARIRDSNSIYPHTIDQNLPIPFLDLPPSYEDIEGLNIPGAPPSMAGNRLRPVSCPDLNHGSSGEFTDQEPLTSSRLYAPVVLPEFFPTDSSNSGRGRSVISSNSLQVTGNAAPSPADSKYKGSRRARARSAVITGRRVVGQYVYPGLAYRSSQRLGAPGEELFWGLEGPPATRGYSDGLPSWA